MRDDIILKEAARLTGYTTRHLAYLLRKGELEGYKLGTIWLVNRDSLEAYAAISRVERDGRFGPRKAGTK